MQIHLVELRLFGDLIEELHDKYEDIPIDLGHKCAYVLEFRASLVHRRIREVSKPIVQGERAQRLTHVLQHLLQKVCHNMGLLLQQGQIVVVAHADVNLEFVDLVDRGSDPK